MDNTVDTDTLLLKLAADFSGTGCSGFFAVVLFTFAPFRECLLEVERRLEFEFSEVDRCEEEDRFDDTEATEPLIFDVLLCSEILCRDDATAIAVIQNKQQDCSCLGMKKFVHCWEGLEETASTALS